MMARVIQIDEMEHTLHKDTLSDVQELYGCAPLRRKCQIMVIGCYMYHLLQILVLSMKFILVYTYLQRIY